MEAIRAFVRDRIVAEDCGHASSCWLWRRCTRDGYGRADIGGRSYQAHRISYEAFRGEIGGGLEIDHLCCVTNCVNPLHLEPVTREENLRRKCVRRGYVIGGKVRMPRPRAARAPFQRKTHCKHGHEYTPETTRLVQNGKGLTVRACRICQRRSKAAQNLRKRNNRRQGNTYGGVEAKRPAAETRTSDGSHSHVGTGL